MGMLWDHRGNVAEVWWGHLVAIVGGGGRWWESGMVVVVVKYVHM